MYAVPEDLYAVPEGMYVLPGRLAFLQVFRKELFAFGCVSERPKRSKTEEVNDRADGGIGLCQ